MKRRFRVRSRAEFQRVFRQGRSFANRSAVLYVLSGDGGGPRVGFSVGRKLGTAVVRNRVKRRLKEAVRELWGQVESDVRLVFIARGAALRMSYQEIRAQVGELLRRSGLVKEHNRRK